MSVTTHVVWAINTPDPEQVILINEQLDLMKNQGATDGSYIETIVSDGNMFTRQWATLNDANTWINFLTPYGPVSTEIVQ